MINREYLYKLLIIILIVGLVAVTLYFNNFKPEKFYSDLNSARNHTLIDIKDSMTTMEKNQIISANCRAYVVDYKEDCESILINEIYKNKTMT